MVAWKKYFRRRLKSSLYAKISFVVFALGVAGTLALFVLFFWFAKDLPQPDKVVRQEGFATKIFDRHGELLYDVFSDQRRTPVVLAEIPQHLKNATIAIEDKNFYKHKGFDPLGILRAFYNIVVHRRLQGGSTLTQQLVKNALLTTERTIPRKIKEFILTVQIENKYSKDQILQMYLNESPYGGTAWGVEAASETYFAKKVTDLNLVESAILAGLTQRPSYYSPLSDNGKAYIGRTQVVLGRMQEDGYITQFQKEEAVKELEKVKISTSSAYLKAPHFVMYVKKILEEKYGAQMTEVGGLRVTTSLDLNLQEEAQKIVTEEIKKSESIHITNGAALVQDTKTGEILAMVGSKDYNDPNYDGKVNVTLSLRQPGSAIKPVTYLTAFKKGYTPSTLVMDTPVKFLVTGQPDYEPANYDGKFRGPMQIRYALGNSVNITAVKMLAQVGLPSLLESAYELGLPSLEPTTANLKRFGYSLTLGGGEVRLINLTSAYSAFANGGMKVEPLAILKVTDKDGHILEEHQPLSGKRVISPEHAFLISHILADNEARKATFGERNSLTIAGRSVAVKTGTTNDRRDNWTIGWSPQLICGVWVGNNDNSPMKQLASGVSGAAPIWRRIIEKALKDKPSLSFEIPAGIVGAEVDAVSGYKAHDGYPSRMEYFVKGTEPQADDAVHTKLKLCRGQNKLATPAQISRGEFEEKEFLVFKEQDPVTPDGVNRWQDGINSWLATMGDSKYHPPSDYCGNQEEMSVVILEPQDRQQLEANEVKIRAEVVAQNELDKLQFMIDGEIKDEIKGKPYERIYNLSRGVHKIKVLAKDVKGNQADREIQIGVQVPWDWQPSPTPAPTSLPTPILTPTPLPTG